MTTTLTIICLSIALIIVATYTVKLRSGSTSTLTLTLKHLFSATKQSLKPINKVAQEAQDSNNEAYAAAMAANDRLASLKPSNKVKDRLNLSYKREIERMNGDV